MIPTFSEKSAGRTTLNAIKKNERPAKCRAFCFSITLWKEPFVKECEA